MGDSFSFQLPSDIKAGTYVLRTELIALHGNMKEQKSTNLKGQIQIYPHCFNVEIIGSGTATPEGVVFPGAYKPNDPSFTFAPFLTYGNSTAGATEENSKFVSLYHCCLY
jgi:lytic cellulose monooxygenase (C1-hydroxylating)